MPELSEIFPNVDPAILSGAKDRFPQTTLLLPSNLELNQIRERLAQAKASTLNELAGLVGNSLRYLTDVSSREIGGHIEHNNGHYSIASLSLGSENSTTREAGKSTYHTHTGNPEEIRRLLEEDSSHRDMPSDVDIIDFGSNPNRQAEVLFGPYYTIILEREDQGFSYLDSVHKIWSALQSTGPFYAQLEAISSHRGENVPAMWIAVHMVHKFFKDTAPNTTFNQNTWLGFVRKCGFKVEIAATQLNLNGAERDLIARESIAPGVYLPITDPFFGDWVQDRTKRGLEFLEEKKVNGKV